MILIHLLDGTAKVFAPLRCFCMLQWHNNSNAVWETGIQILIHWYKVYSALTSCSVLQPFWTQVWNLTYRLTDVQLGGYLVANPLHLDHVSSRQCKCSLTIQLLTQPRNIHHCSGNKWQHHLWESGFAKFRKYAPWIKNWNTGIL